MGKVDGSEIGQSSCETMLGADSQWSSASVISLNFIKCLKIEVYRIQAGLLSGGLINV